MNEVMRIEGFKEMDAALAEFTPVTARNIAIRALIAAAQPMVDMARQLAPVLTGRLRREISASARVKRSRAGTDAYRNALSAGLSEGAAVMAMRNAQRGTTDPNSAEVAVGPSVKAPEGLLQEFGTAHHRAQPFLTPAFEAKWREVLDRIADFLRREVDKAIIRAQRRALKVKPSDLA